LHRRDGDTRNRQTTKFGLPMMLGRGKNGSHEGECRKPENQAAQKVFFSFQKIPFRGYD
jgi:hypothetical protein